MHRRVNCKFYAQGSCFKGEFCNYAHDLTMTPQKKACKFYPRGACKFGSRCRFEHSAVGASQNSVPSDPSIENIQLVETNVQADSSAENGGNDRMICLPAVDGNCPLSESCPDIHGDLCATCGKYLLHPFNSENRERHVKECEKNKALERSREIECSVCLELVLSKASESERKFGLLSECDHAFCMSCIKKWRSSSSPLGMEANSAARACPVCRKISYYVIPSLIWYSSKEEKQEIIDKYKAKLKSIDCRYFNYGNGSCRHGANCFYKHEVKAGSSRRSKSSNAKYWRSNRQHRGRWDNDYIDFEDFANLVEFDAMLQIFEEMFFVDEEEAIDDGAPEDEVPDSFEFKDLCRKLEEMEMRLSGDYDEEDFLEPWQRDFLYAQLGYDDYDDYTNYHLYEYDDDDSEDDLV